MKDQITIDDFAKLDIRIGTILKAEKIPDSFKLIKMLINFGEEKRQILAGLAESVEDPTTLIGKQMPFIYNLQPRTMMGLESQGMVLAVKQDNKAVLLHPDTPVDPGAPLS